MGWQVQLVNGCKNLVHCLCSVRFVWLFNRMSSWMWMRGARLFFSRMLNMPSSLLQRLIGLINILMLRCFSVVWLSPSGFPLSEKSGNSVLTGMSGNFAVCQGIFVVKCRLHGCLFSIYWNYNKLFCHWHYWLQPLNKQESPLANAK